MNFVSIPPERGSYLVVAPTGSGKTTSILSNIPTYLKNYDRVFLTFPTKALMFEISQKLTSNKITHLVDNSDVRITKNVNVAEWFENKVIVCSYEKLDSMLLVFPTLLKNALVVIDEVHLATDSERALSILSILASVKKEPTADVIVMSATIPEYKDLAEYLGAQVIVHKATNDQDVIYHEIPYTPRGTVAYLSTLISRIHEIISADPSKPTIVFRAARRHCDIIADQLCKLGIKGFSGCPH